MIAHEDNLSNAELRRRLEEAEDTLRAIREGEIDALVVRRAHDDEIFTLEGPESYRSFMEAMDLGAAALDPSFHLIYANKALCEILGRSFEALQQQGLLASLDTASAATIETLARDAAHGRQSAEIHLTGPNERYLMATATPVQLGPTSGVAITFTDLTERVRIAAAETAERAARAIIASANEAVVVCDAGGVITHANPAVAALCPGDPVGRHFDAALTLNFADNAGIRNAHALLAMAASGQSVRGIEASLPDAPKVKDVMISAAPLMVGDQPGEGCVITLVDLSQRKAAERQQQLLMGELDHRVRNTLALVLSISTLTGYNAKTVEEFQHAFVGRVEALAATHTLLARKSWIGLSIEDVVIAELAPYIKSDADRIKLAGLNVTVTPQAAVALGLVFHELVTNAVKYGALCGQQGRIEILALRDPVTSGLGITWTESEGPTVAPPTRSGFGRTVITRSLSYSDGGAEIDFLPGGVVCKIRVPKSDLTNEAPAP